LRRSNALADDRNADLQDVQRSAVHQSAFLPHVSPRRSCRIKRRREEDPHLANLRQLMADGVSLDRAWHERAPGRAADLTVEALMFSLRERGVAALNEPDTQRRLVGLSKAQLVEVATRLQKLKPQIARAWTDSEIKTLIRFQRGLRRR
jgi:erythromycin esterase-like protein